MAIIIQKLNLRIHYIILLVSIVSCNSYPSKDRLIDGSYEYYGKVAMIKGDSLSVVCNEGPRYLFNNAILAECKITPIGDGFYSLFSYDMPMIAFRNETIELVERAGDDIPTVTFRFPNYRMIEKEPLKVHIEASVSGREKVYVCDSCNYSIKLPEKDMWEFKLGIAPTEYYTVNGFENYTGLLVYRDFFNQYDVSDYNLIITLPDVTENLFVRWFLKDTIVRISDDKLLLEGNEYKKVDSSSRK